MRTLDRFRRIRRKTDSNAAREQRFAGLWTELEAWEDTRFNEAIGLWQGCDMLKVWIKRMPLLSVALFFLLLLSGCDSHDKATIQWQLPLTAPEDPHGGQDDQATLPEWATSVKGSASLMFLQTTTARSFDVDVIKDEKKMFHDWDVTLLGLANGLRTQSGAFIDDKNVHNPAAFVELSYKNKLVYRGWLYQEFPELFGPDTPGWKLWLKAVTVRAPSEEGIEKQGSLSSAG
ncbi:MAG: DUF2155 domain-containing protein [Mariprofundaceae bacterium]